MEVDVRYTHCLAVDDELLECLLKGEELGVAAVVDVFKTRAKILESDGGRLVCEAGGHGK